MIDIALFENERIDDLERNGYRIIQNKKKFCFGMDAVLLSGFICESEAVNKPEYLKMADMGTGTGIIPILIHGKLKKRSRSEGPWLYGLEIQEEMADMALRSVRLNDLENDICFIKADIKQSSDILGRGCFDAVSSNPPYKKQGKGLESPDMSRAISRSEILCTLEDVIRQAGLMLKQGGRFFMVHRPERLTEIMTLLRQYKLEPKRLRMVHSFSDSEASMVMIEALKGGGQFMIIEKPLIIYKEKGIYHEIDGVGEIEDVQKRVFALMDEICK